MGDLGGILFVGGAELALAGFSGALDDFMEHGKISLVRARTSRMAETMAITAGLSRRCGTGVVGGYVIIIREQL